MRCAKEEPKEKHLEKERSWSAKKVREGGQPWEVPVQGSI